MWRARCPGLPATRNCGRFRSVSSAFAGSALSAGASIKLANLNKRITDLLQITKLLTVFDVHDSEYKALESFRTAA